MALSRGEINMTVRISYGILIQPAVCEKNTLAACKTLGIPSKDTSYGGQRFWP